eukprot:251903-Pyramimonas_sp.AAC.1
MASRRNDDDDDDDDDDEEEEEEEEFFNINRCGGRQVESAWAETELAEADRGGGRRARRAPQGPKSVGV